MYMCLQLLINYCLPLNFYVCPQLPIKRREKLAISFELIKKCLEFFLCYF